MKYYLSTLIELLYELDRPPSLVWFTVVDITLIESVTKCNVWLLHRREVERRFPVVPWSVTSVSCVWTVDCPDCPLPTVHCISPHWRHVPRCLYTTAPPSLSPGQRRELVHTAITQQQRSEYQHPLLSPLHISYVLHVLQATSHFSQSYIWSPVHSLLEPQAKSSN